MCLAVPGCVREIFMRHGVRTGKLDFGGVVKEVCLEYVPEVAVGDYAIVHVGVAISKVDEESARETLKTLAEMGLLEEEIPSRSDEPPDSREHPAFQGDPR